MVPIALVNLSDLTATIMPFPPSALCVFKILQLEKCKGGPNNVHKAPETSWGPAGVSHTHTPSHIRPDNAFIADITLTPVSLWTSTISSPTNPSPPLFIPLSPPLFLSPSFLDLSLPLQVARGLFVSSLVHKLGTLGDHVPRTCWEKASHYTLRALYVSGWVPAGSPTC